MSAMWNNPAISLHNFNDLANHYDDFVVTDGTGRGNELHERLESISGLNLLDSALHSECVVTSSLVLQDGSKIQVVPLQIQVVPNSALFQKDTSTSIPFYNSTWFSIRLTPSTWPLSDLLLSYPSTSPLFSRSSIAEHLFVAK